MLTQELKKAFLQTLLKKTAMATDSDLFLDDDTGESYLPKPIAAEIIREVYERNICRQLFRGIPVEKRTKTVRAIAYDKEHIYQVATGEGTETDIGDDDTKQLEFSTSTVVLKPGKLAAKAEVANDDIDDNDIDVVDEILSSFGIAFARAEEKAMLSDSAQDLSSNAYAKVSDGLFYYAKDANKNTTTVSINASTDYGMTDGISLAIKELGVYARDEIILICSDKFAHYLRTDRGVKNDVFGSAAVVQKGILPKIYGVTVFSSSYVDALDSNVALVVPRLEPIIGYGRKYKIKRKEDIERDSQIFVCFERFDFKLRHKTSSKCDAIVKLMITAS